MKFNNKITNILLVALSTLALSACSTAKKSGVGSGDVYTGNDTVAYLASGVKDKVFFSTISSASLRSKIGRKTTVLILYFDLANYYHITTCL